MKVQREDRALGKNFDYRYRLPNVYLADLPVLSDVSCDDAALRESGFWNRAPMPNGFCQKEIPYRYHDSLRNEVTALCRARTDDSLGGSWTYRRAGGRRGSGDPECLCEGVAGASPPHNLRR